jgi:hypothetical protein
MLGMLGWATEVKSLSVFDPIDSESPFGWLLHLRDISEWLA